MTPPTLSMGRISEKEWQTTVTDLAKVYGWMVFHQLDSRGTEAGWPDLVLIRPPECLFVELKSERGRVRPEQSLVLESLAACGLEVYVWRPAGWPEIATRLRPGKGSREPAV